MGMYLGGQKISPIIKSGVEINNQDKTITENGTYTADAGYTGLGEVTVNVSGGGSSSGEFLVQVVDYDGIVLKSERLDEGDTFTLPSQPSHTGLTFQSWSSPVTITNNTVTVTNSDITIGATYTTASGLSEFDITLTTTTGLSITLNMDGTKDWGDGTSNTETSHTYASTGDYTITCNGSTMTTSSSSGLFGQTSSVYNYYVKNVRLGSSVTSIGNSAFYFCYSLTNITIPNSITSIGDNAFRYCYSLVNIIIPSMVTSINTNTFYYCTSLKCIVISNMITSIGTSAFERCYSLVNVTIPDSVTSIDNYAFSDCHSLTNITIPNSVTSIGTYIFSSCYSLTNITIPNSITSISYGAFSSCTYFTKIIIPNSVTSIDTYAFYNCYSIIEYDFSNHTIVPTLSNNAFSAINKICKIYVPWDLYNNWKIATNWSTYADYISNKNPATLNFTVSPSNSTIYVNNSQIQGTSTTWVGSSVSYVIHDSTNNVILSNTQTGIIEGATVNITADLTNSNKITLSTGVIGLLPKFTIDGLTFNATDEGNGNYSISVVGSGTEINYYIEGGSSYMDVEGTITTISSDITETVTMTPVTETSFVRPNLTADGTLGGNSFAVKDVGAGTSTTTNAWKAVDNPSDYTYWNGTIPSSGVKTYVFYNPDALKVSKLKYSYYSTTYQATSVSIQASNDNSTWEDITSTYDFDASDYTYVSTLTNNKFYKYYKLLYTPDYSYIRVSNLAITATYKVPVS